MRILMVYPNRNRYLCPAPVGALLVTERLRHDGHDVRFLDLMHARDPQASLRAALAEHRPELVGFSIRNVDNQTMGNLDQPLDEAAELAALVKRESAAPLLLGGTAVTTFPARIRAKLGADYAMAGDDADAVARFVASLAKGAPDPESPGLVARLGGRTIENPPSIRGYRKQRFTGHADLDLTTYRKRGYYDCGVVTHSGCPLGCSFCDAHRTFGREYVLRDPQTVVEELTELCRLRGARSVWLINSGINRPLAYGKEILARIAEARLKLVFSCIVEPGEFDAELARLLRRAGCTSAMIFGSTLSDPVLERNQPFYRAKDVVEIASRLRDAKVPYFLGQMYGAPGETLAGIRDSLELAYRLKPAMIITGFGFRVQWDTPLREVAVREGMIAADDDCFTARFYTSPETPPAEAQACIKAFRRRHPWQAARFAAFIGRSIADQLFR